MVCPNGVAVASCPRRWTSSWMPESLTQDSQQVLINVTVTARIHHHHLRWQWFYAMHPQDGSSLSKNVKKSSRHHDKTQTVIMILRRQHCCCEADMWEETFVPLRSLNLVLPPLLWPCLTLVKLKLLPTLPPRFPLMVEGITPFCLHLWASSEHAETWMKWTQSTDRRLHPSVHILIWSINECNTWVNVFSYIPPLVVIHEVRLFWQLHQNMTFHVKRDSAVSVFLFLFCTDSFSINSTFSLFVSAAGSVTHMTSVPSHHETDPSAESRACVFALLPLR